MSRSHKRDDEKSQESETSEEEDTSGDHNVWNAWVAAEEDVLQLVERIRARLTSIHPGIGDEITLSRFVHFVETWSTCL